MSPGTTIISAALIAASTSFMNAQPPIPQRWTPAQAQAWYDLQPWLVGCNFIPSTAINQLEMWQAETFDPATIDRELGWARSIGFNTVRVFLHVIPWESDSSGFLRRIDEYLAIAHRRGIRTMFVLFDDCWNRDPQPGRQPAPQPGVHNSGWMQCPGERRLKDPSTYPLLLRYTRSIMERFATDERVLMWDLYNEPGNSDYGRLTIPLLMQVLEAARSVNPSQPITVGTWMPDNGDFAELNRLQLAHSDIVTFHSYADSAATTAQIQSLRPHGRPLICTEYMARTRNSRFETHLPLFKREKVGAINWGLVSGKTNTIFPWGSPAGSPEPEPWFHDVFRPDGSPYTVDEVASIRRSTLTPAIELHAYGSLPDGRAVTAYTLRAANGMEATIINFGGIVTSLTAPNRTGALEDIVLGYDHLESYIANPSYFGALIGRYGNRIGAARFTLNGRPYALAANDGPNHLHGGPNGFHKALWGASTEVRPEGPALVLTHTSEDGDEGYPGRLDVNVTYTLTNEGALRIEYAAITSKTTVVNLTHHSYFNLSGNAERDVLAHELFIDADRMTPVDRELITTGALANVDGTPFDFRAATPIGQRIGADHEQLRFGRGYDHNWVLNRSGAGLALAARVFEPASGRVMEVWTTEPGLQFYSGNFLDGTAVGKRKTAYRRRTGFCLESQHYPDSPNKPSFPSVVLQPGNTYRTTTEYRFSTR